ncbi:unnamed protein product, partial [marine sediment metagenome]
IINETIEQNLTDINITEPDLTINETITNVTSGNLTIQTTQGQAVLGQPVKWKKQITTDIPMNLIVELPKEAENIIVQKIEKEGDEEIIKSRITGYVMGGRSDGFLSRFLERIFKLTGGVIGIEETDEKVEVNIEENATEFEIEYETPAPYAMEEETEKGKEIIIIGPDEIHYENVLSFTTLPEEISKEKIKLYRTTDGVKELTTITNYLDADNNGLIEQIEWITPSLSE